MTWFNPNSVVVPNVTWSHHPKDVIRSMREGQAAAEFLDSYQGAVNPYGIAMTSKAIYKNPTSTNEGMPTNSSDNRSVTESIFFNEEIPSKWKSLAPYPVTRSKHTSKKRDHEMNDPSASHSHKSLGLGKLPDERGIAKDDTNVSASSSKDEEEGITEVSLQAKKLSVNTTIERILAEAAMTSSAAKQNTPVHIVFEENGSMQASHRGSGGRSTSFTKLKEFGFSRQSDDSTEEKSNFSNLQSYGSGSYASST